MKAEKEHVPVEEELFRLLREKGCTVSAAESCTGGMVASRIVNVAGASYVLSQSYVTYSNQAKHKLLGVRKATLKKYTEVSGQTAAEMAKGVAKAAHADVGISVTGIAGPDGGTKEKPVGLVYIGCYYRGKKKVKKYIFEGDRMEVRSRAAEQALRLACHMLKTDKA